MVAAGDIRNEPSDQSALINREENIKTLNPTTDWNHCDRSQDIWEQTKDIRLLKLVLDIWQNFREEKKRYNSLIFTLLCHEKTTKTTVFACYYNIKPQHTYKDCMELIHKLLFESIINSSAHNSISGILASKLKTYPNPKHHFQIEPAGRCASGCSREGIWEHLPVLRWGSAGMLLLQQLCTSTVTGKSITDGILTD